RRVAFGRAHERLEPAVTRLGVVVEENEVVAARVRGGEVVAADEAEVLTRGEHAYERLARGQVVKVRGGAVGRAVVDDDDLAKVRSPLRQQPFEAPPRVVELVEDADEDGDGSVHAASRSTPVAARQSRSHSSCSSEVGFGAGSPSASRS